MGDDSDINKLIKKYGKDKMQAVVDRLHDEVQLEEAAELKALGKAPLRLFEPFPKQVLVLKDETPIIVVTGGNDSGKTKIGCAEALFLQTKTHPYKKEWNEQIQPMHGMVLVEDTKQASQHGAAQSKILEMIPEELVLKYKFNRNVLEQIWFHDGGTMVIRSSKAGRASIQGARFNWVWVDENCIKDVDFYDELIFRVPDTGKICKIVITATPNLDPVKDMFLDEVLLPRAEDPDNNFDVSHHTISLFDNPYIEEETKKFLMRNAAGDEDQLRARFEGDYKKKAGIIYAFKKNTHVVPPISRKYIKEHADAIFRIIDPHPVKPIAVSFIACMKDGSVIQFDELFFDGLVKTVAEKMKIICDGLGHLVKKTIIDYSGNAGNRINGKSVRDEFLANGIACVNCVKDVDIGINYVRQLLHFTEKEQPKLFIASNCINTIREIMKYRQHPKTGDPIKKDDEFMDNLRYFACDKDAQFYFLERENKDVRKGFRIIKESTIRSSEGNTDKNRRVRARQRKAEALLGWGAMRR